MNVFEKLTIPGEHPVIIAGPAGQLEIILDVPQISHAAHLAILGHPHSLQGGTMNNKVVTTMARAFRTVGIPSIRFNFRGVGRSEGAYDAGVGESEDMRYILDLCPPTLKKIWFAGFSFGSYVAYRALKDYQSSYTTATSLITIAPSVQKYDYTEPLKEQTPWLIIIGDQDELVPLDSVINFAKQSPLHPKVEVFPETSHFFHGKLMDLKACLLSDIQSGIGS